MAGEPVRFNDFYFSLQMPDGWVRVPNASAPEIAEGLDPKVRQKFRLGPECINGQPKASSR
jgi:hypothetical protein